MFESAKWIAAPDTQQASPLFRRAFTVEPGLQSASLSLCALGYGVATVNGKPVTEDVLTTPLTKFDATLLYNTYDVTPLLTEGQNALGVMLGNGWYNDVAATWDYEKAPWRHHPKLLAQLDLFYQDGSQETVVTDPSWSTADGPCRYNHVRCGEVWDARLEQPGWDCPGFPAPGWKAARVCRAPGGELKPADLPPIRVVRTLETKEVFPGVYDLGENTAGWVRISLSGEAGAQVDLVYSERLNPDGTFDTEDMNRFCAEEFAHHDRYFLKGEGVESWEPHFCYHGFRYVRVETQAQVLSVEGREVHTDLKSVGEFSCSDELLNKIHQATRRSTLTNFHSIPTDCPHREQNGWTGDAQLSAEQALLNFDMTDAYRKWLRDFVDCQRPSGQLPGIVPTGGWGYNWGSGPAWDSALILIPYYVWRYTGDLSLIQEFWPNMVQYMDYLSTMTVDGLVDFGLGDWCPPKGAALCPTQLTDTAYAYADAMAMAEMAFELDKPTGPWEDQAWESRTAFREKYVRDGKVIPESQTAYACAIYQGLLDREEVEAAAARLNELVLEKGCHIDCGILGNKYLYRSLADFGYGETLYRMVTNPTCPSYAWWIANGMTTLCEDWEMTISLNHHMFSEVDLWFYRYLAGIQLDEDRLTIAPQCLPQLEWVKAESRRVKVYWDREKIQIDTPRQALLVLDGQQRLLMPGSYTFPREES